MRSTGLAVCCVALLVTGCETTPGRERVERLDEGMTKVEVSATLGAPHEVVRDGEREAWRYCLVGALNDEYLVAWFAGNELLGASAKLDHDFGPCVQQMKSFSWDDSPQPQT